MTQLFAPEIIKRCRSCGNAEITSVLDLGVVPIADRLLTKENMNQRDMVAPITLGFCEECALVQILETIPPEILFDAEYPYFSSTSTTLLAHSRQNAAELIERLDLGPSSFVVELASNDGYMLRNFVEHGIPVFGIDPAPEPAAAARLLGIETMLSFFGQETARSLVERGRKADLVIANNVLAHVADLNGFVAGIATITAETGLVVIEVPYVVDLMDHCEFDTIYHQHLCYFSVTSLDRLFRRHGLFLNDIRRLPIHGGSLRLYIGKSAATSDRVRTLLAEESRAGLDRISPYVVFSRRVEDLKRELSSLLANLKKEGARLAAYGAAAKGTALLGACGIGQEILDYVVDRNRYKQGRFLPGNRLRIYGPEKLIEDQPDYVLLLPWNLAAEILKEQQEYIDRGGRFIVPIPKPRVAGETERQIMLEA
jgi:SAM-dependent methyltransferase